MITKLAIATVWVLDQDESKEFYTGKLGFEVRTDMTMGPGMRWLTVGPKEQPDVELTLMVPGSPATPPEAAEQIRSLVAQGMLGAGVFGTDDCRATHKELAARGVVFLQEPTERPYGIEAIFRDNSGNWFSLTQRFADLNPDAPWGLPESADT